jgi:glutaredoxin
MIVRLSFVVALCMSALAGNAAAEVYRWVDANGRVVYSDSPPRQAGARTVKLEGNVAAPVVPPEVQPAATASRKVKLYTAAWCGYCKQARAHLKSRNVPFEDIDVETTERGRREFAAINGNGVPVIFVGALRMNGYEQGGLQDMLKAAGW